MCIHCSIVVVLYCSIVILHCSSSHRGEVSHRDYFFTEYEFAVGSHGGENSPGIFLRNIYTSCVVTG